MPGSNPFSQSSSVSSVNSASATPPALNSSSAPSSGGGYSGIFGFLSGLVDNAFAGIRQKRQRKWALQDYERQLRDQRQLIQEEREYNDFSSIVSRAAKAGINPLHALGIAPATGGNTTTNVPDIDQVQNTGFSPASISGVLDNVIKREQARSLKIENDYKAESLEIQNAYIAAKTKTEESLQILNSQEVQNKQALEAYTLAQTRYQELLSEYQSQATPQLLDNLRAEYDKMYAETTKLDNENAVFKEQFAANMRYVLAQTYQAVYQAKYYRSASEWVGYRAQTERMNATTAEKNVARQEVADKAIADYNTAYMEWRKDMSSSEKWANYTRSLEAVGNLLLSGFSMTRQPNQLAPLNVPGAPSIPYGGSNPFDTPYK